MIPPAHLLYARLGLIGYEPAFLTAPAATVADGLQVFGRSMHTLVYGVDQGIGRVPYGFISTGPGGFGSAVCTLRGTQMPQGKIVEWLDDFDAFLEQCPFAPTGCRWHRGFGRVYSTLTVSDGTPLAEALQAIPGVRVHGHSLAGPLATYAAAESKGAAPTLFASPKCGDSGLRDYFQQLWPFGTQSDPVVSYANPNDAVPKVPITVDWPFKLEDFQQVVSLFEMLPASVTPPIPGNWDDSHQLSNYLRLLIAAAG